MMDELAKRRRKPSREEQYANQMADLAISEARVEMELKRLGDGVVALRDEWAQDPTTEPFAVRLHKLLCNKIGGE